MPAIRPHRKCFLVNSMLDIHVYFVLPGKPLPKLAALSAVETADLLTPFALMEKVPSLPKVPSYYLEQPDAPQFIPVSEVWKMLRAEEPVPLVLLDPSSQMAPQEELINKADPLAISRFLLECLNEIPLTAIRTAQSMLPAGDPLSLLFETATANRLLDTAPKAPPAIAKGIARETVPFNPETIHRIFLPEGSLDLVMPGFRHREQQSDMAMAVARAFQDAEFLLAEAGTGVGKTLAYLVPALYWAAATGEKIVVSTRTRALQKQLAEKDLPNLVKALDFPFTWAIIFGRENYLCRRRWQAFLRSRGELTRDEIAQTIALLFWLERGGSGIVQDLAWDARELPFWHRVKSQRHACQGGTCPEVRRCFYQSARKRQDQADLVVINHALLLTEASSNASPEERPGWLIVDEAHNLERIGFEHLGIQFGIDDAAALLKRLVDRKEGIPRGYLPGLAVREPAAAADIKLMIQTAGTAAEQLQQLVQVKMPALAGGPAGSRRVHSDELPEELFAKTGQLTDSLQELEAMLTGLTESLGDSEESREVTNLALEIAGLADSLFTIAERFAGDRADEIAWIDLDEKGIRKLAVSPIDTGEELYNRLWRTASSVILVSATLTVAGSFQHIRRGLGLDLIDPDRVRDWHATSPFDYENNCRILAVTDLAQPGEAGYAEQVGECIAQVADAVKRRTLALFTAKRELRHTAERLHAHPNHRGRLVAQYRDGEFGTLVARLSGREDALLLGTETFWEGVDLPGDLLNCLIVTRLPFRPPSDPLTEARSERLRREGMDPFTAYALPDAVLRFRQGIGRLIRTETDTGVIIVLDRRFCPPPNGKRYGQIFRMSMPEALKIEDICRADLAGRLKEWFG